MPWYLIEYKEIQLKTARIQARSAKAARAAFDEDPNRHDVSDTLDPEYEVVSVERDDDQDE